MRTMNLKSNDGWPLFCFFFPHGRRSVFGQPFVVEDSITVDYQSILTAGNTMRNTLDRTIMWQRYMPRTTDHTTTHNNSVARTRTCIWLSSVDGGDFVFACFEKNERNHQKRVSNV